MEAKNEGSDENVDEVMLPGFRFHPTDEELVGFYLKRKVQQRPLSIELIKQLDIYKFDPWDLPKIASGGEKEWYFFCPRDRKYRNSTRPNRVTGAGFWKATGTDRPIYSSEGNKCIGLKKSLVFYKGRAAKGVKTDWMMHEFRLPSLCETVPSKKCFDRRIPANDSWAICRIFKKTSPVTPRTPSHSWVSPSLREYNPSTRTLNSSSSNNNNTSNFSPQNTTNTSTSSSSYPGHANPHNYLQSPNNFSLLDHISSFMPIYPTTKDEIDNKPFFDQQLLGFPPMVDLPPSYILPQLEDPCETMSKSTIDISSMLLNNVPPSGNYNVNFDGVPSLTNGQCHDDDDDDFGHNLEDYQDFQSALMGNLNNMLHGGDEYDLRGVNHNVGSFPIAELLPLVLPETWKSSSSTSLMWDCAPLL